MLGGRTYRRPAEEGGTVVPYLNCPSCRLTVYSGVAAPTLEDCPRCRARLGKVSRLFHSQLPHRLLRSNRGETAAEHAGASGPHGD